MARKKSKHSHRHTLDTSDGQGLLAGIQSSRSLNFSMSSPYVAWDDRYRRPFTQRYRCHIIAAVCVVFVFLIVSLNHPVEKYQQWTAKPSEGPPQVYDETVENAPKIPPPKYEELRKWEAALPQQNLDLPFPEGGSGRYVKFSNQIIMLGWNNCLNEVLMLGHLAHASNRSYVFKDYTWKPEYYPWPQSQYLDNPPRTPLNALISGPTSGQPWGPGDYAPRAISEPWFEQACPWNERRFIKTGSIKPSLADKSGLEVFEGWVKLLRDAPERCIEIESSPEDSFPQTFDLWLWGSERILSLWENFSQSPTSQLLRTSHIVAAAVKRNEYLFIPRGPRPTTPISTNPYDRMLAMHIRRGDYKRACTELLEAKSTFYSWNQLPALPDPLSFPHFEFNSTDYINAFMERCLPTPQQIVKKARTSREAYQQAAPGQLRALDTLYLLTNEKGEWMDELKKEFQKDGWNTIVTSNDLTLDSEGIDTNMAIDMDIARMAAVFVGNGWSSFTSNIVHRRLVDGKEPISIRFW